MNGRQWSRERLIEYAKSLGFTVEEGLPQPGDSYIAGRNLEPELLTCAEVNPSGWIRAKESYAYSFDWHECVKVRIL